MTEFWRELQSEALTKGQWRAYIKYLSHPQQFECGPISEISAVV